MLSHYAISGADVQCRSAPTAVRPFRCSGRKREPMAAYRFGSLEGTLRRPGVIGLMSTIG